MKCVCQDGAVLAGEVEKAFHLFERMKGLMFRASLPAGKAMLLSPCPQIHTCFMRFPIDVLFLTKDNEVVYVMENMKPWRLSPIVRRAAKTLEMPGGTLQGRVKQGDQIYFKD